MAVLHDLALNLLLARPLADDPSGTIGAVGTLIGAIFGSGAALIAAITGLYLAARKRNGSSAPTDAPTEDKPDDTPPAPAGRTTRVETGWVGWAQARIARLEGDLLAQQEVSARATRKAEEYHDECEELKTWKATTLATEQMRRERFLRLGLDPDSGEPLPPRTTPAPSP